MTKRTVSQVSNDITALVNEAGALIHAGAEPRELLESLCVGLAHIASYTSLRMHGVEGGRDAMEALGVATVEAFRGSFQETCLMNGDEDPYIEKTHNQQLADSILKEIESE